MPEFPREYPRRGEIYWAPSTAKVRPVVVVSNDTGNKFGSTVIVAPLTRTIPAKKYPVNVHLHAGDPLPAAGVITCGSLYTLEKDDLNEYRADLRPEQLAEVDAALKASLALK